MEQQKAFTLAEVLITLVIIGVVAAITIPILHNSTNDKQYNVACQKAQATIGEAFKLMTVNGEIDKNKSTKEFTEEVLPKYLKIAKICDNATDCGFSNKNKRPNGVLINNNTGEMPTNWKQITDPTALKTPPLAYGEWGELYEDDNPTTLNNNLKSSYFFQTLDGYSVNFFYNPYCAADSKDKTVYFTVNGNVQEVFDVFCFNAIYDMNGSKGPNIVGKDIGFVGSLYNGYEAQSVSVSPYNKRQVTVAVPFNEANTACKNLDKDNNWILPDINELSLMYLNRYLIDDYSSCAFTSRTPVKNNTVLVQRVRFNKSQGQRYWDSFETAHGCYRCVRNNILK